MAEIGAVVLAAGRASRYRAAGGQEQTKLVARVDGEPIVRRVALAALASRTRPVVAVVGHAREAVEGALAGLPIDVAFNPEFASGLASSLRTGLAGLPPAVAGAVILLGDMPRVEPALIDALIEAFTAHPHVLAAAPIQKERRGNPVLLSRALFPAAMRLSGDEGARPLLSGLDPTQLIEVMADGWDASFDVDTPCDLETADRHLSARRERLAIDKLC